MKKIIILALTLFIANSAFAEFIEFEYKHSLRIPYNRVSVKISGEYKKYELVASTEPSDSSEKWYYSRKRIRKFISKEEFDALAKLLNNLKIPLQLDGEENFGADGTTWILRWGDFQNSVEFKIWSPDIDMQARNTTGFIRICEMIIKLADLPVQDVLQD